MAILDQQTLFSDAQAITADAASTNVIDLGPIMSTRDIGPGKAIPVLIQVVEAFAGLTSLNVAIQVCAAEGFGSGVKTVAKSAEILLADLKVGYEIPLSWIPKGTDLRYMRLYYDVTGTGTAGKITAGITLA